MADVTESTMQREVRNLVYDIRNQYPVSDVVWMGTCPRCDSASISARVCGTCLMDDLKALVGVKDAMDTLTHILAARAALRASTAHLEALVERVGQ